MLRLRTRETESADETHSQVRRRRWVAPALVVIGALLVGRYIRRKRE